MILLCQLSLTLILAVLVLPMGRICQGQSAQSLASLSQDEERSLAIKHLAPDNGDSQANELLSNKALFEELFEITVPMVDMYHEERREPSEFMIQEYNDVADHDTGQLRARSNSIRDSSNDLPELHEEIYSFPSHDVSHFSHRSPSRPALAGWKLSFNLQQFHSKNRNRKVKYAELAIYGKHCYSDSKPQRIAARRTAVEAYVWKRPGKDEEFRWVNVSTAQKIRVRDCWQRFNVTAALAVNEGLEHTRPRESEILLVSMPREERQKQTGNYGLEDLLELHDRTTGKHAVLVVYSGKTVPLADENTASTSRSKRNVGFSSLPTNRHARPKSKKKDPMEVEDSSYTKCARRNLQVEPKHLGVAILAPRNGIDIFRCAGSCGKPASGIPTTFHAAMESLFNSFERPRDSEVAQMKTGPCCVPSQLQAISVMLATPNNGVQLMKVYKKLIATRCSCR